MKDTYILRTVGLCEHAGSVIIETLGWSDDECMVMEWDARSLLEDIPTLYKLAKQAVEKEEQEQLDRFVKFKKELSEDWKGQRGRKKK